MPLPTEVILNQLVLTVIVVAIVGLVIGFATRSQGGYAAAALFGYCFIALAAIYAACNIKIPEGWMYCLSIVCMACLSVFYTFLILPGEITRPHLHLTLAIGGIFVGFFGFLTIQSMNSSSFFYIGLTLAGTGAGSILLTYLNTKK